MTDHLKSASLLAESMQEADDSNEAEFESDELARQINRRLLRGALADDVGMLAQDPIDPPVERQRGQPNSVR